MTNPDTIARVREAKKLAGLLTGFARVFRDFPDAELWGRPEEAEHAAGIMEQTRDALVALAETAATPVEAGADVAEGLLREIVAAQNVGPPYRGWSISKLNASVEKTRALLGLPSAMGEEWSKERRAKARKALQVLVQAKALPTPPVTK